MKRLIYSSRFWATVIGSVLSAVAYKIFNDPTYSFAILGAFTAIVATTAVKDSMRAHANKNYIESVK